MNEPVATTPGSPSPMPPSSVVEGDDGEDHAHRHDRPGHGVAGGGEPVGGAHDAGVGEAAGVRDRGRHDEADDDGGDGQHEAVAEEVEVAVEQRRAPRAPLLADGPRRQLGGRRAEGHDDDGARADAWRRRPATPAGGGVRMPASSPPARPNRARPRSIRSMPMTSRANTSTSVASSAAASRSYVPRQIRNTPTDTVSTPKYCTVAKSVSVSITTTAAPAAMAGRSIGSTTRRVASAERRAERAGHEVGARRLVPQRGPGQQVHVRVQRQRQRDDGAGHRADVGEPGVAAELVAPPRLHRPGDAEHRGGDEAEDVAGHGEREDQGPADAPGGRGSGRR